MSSTVVVRSRGIVPVSAIALLVCVAALAVAFQDGLAAMWTVWNTSEEYSHGPVIPFIVAFLIWQKRFVLGKLGEQGDPGATNLASNMGSKWGVVLIAAAALLNVMGTLATLHVLQQYAFVLAIYGIALALIGWRGIAIVWAPLLLLAMMVPLPNFFLNNLSANLQLISSQIGVAVIRLFGISVFVEGNVIDLGAYRLQVAEACSGLRYLFPLLTLSFLMAYLFKVALWKRIVLMLSAIPITIGMNSLRIGIIGVMVEHWGTSMAEGFLHDFQGWAVFMASGIVLVLEMMILARFGRDARPWREVFGLEFPSANGGSAWTLPRRWSTTTLSSAAVLVVVAISIWLLPQRVDDVPQRESLLSFPHELNAWVGRRDRLDDVYVDTLKFDDYLLADYRHVGATSELPQNSAINMYVAWYDSQRAGQSAHSPRTCLPGGGWKIADLQTHRVANTAIGGTPLTVNRALIVNGQERQLVYYWFQQRGRVVTNEYMVKWYLFWDAITRNRTDGALVRLIAPVPAGASIESADKSLTEFLTASAPQLTRFIPN